MKRPQDLVRTYRRWIGPAVLVALAGCASAPAAATTPIARYVAATGGARWDAIAAIETRATLAVGGLTGEVRVLEDVRTGRSRSATKLGPVETAEGFDGEVSWEQAIGGEVAVLDAGPARARAQTARWMTMRGFARPDRTRYRDLGARSLGARRLHAVEATPPGGAPIALWFDDATGLLARTVYAQGSNAITTTFDDYRAVDGVMVAFRQVIEADDPRNTVTLTVTEAHAVPAPAAAAFARPGTDADRLQLAGGATELPFELINNHIYIRAQVDGQPVRMIVDTGGLNILTPAAAARLGLAGEGKMAMSGAGDRKVDVGFATARELVVGGVTLARPVFYVVDFEQLSDVEGEPIDGLVGFELFQRLAVRIDYPAGRLGLRRPDAFTPPAGAIAVPFELRDRTPIVVGAIDGIAARFTIDTGARNSLTITKPFVAAHQLEARYHPAFETVTGWGVGGAARAKPVRIGELKLGDAVVGGVVGELFTGDKGAFVDPETSGNIGGGVLKRFVVTFDYRARRMYLEPTAAPARDVFDRAGMFFLRDGDAIRVVAVVPGGPAARAGIAEGDRIAAIDGAAIATRPLAAWRAAISTGAVGARHTLTVERDGQRRDRAIVLAELLP